MTRPLNESELQQIKAMLQAGRKDEATQVYRQITGAGIFETKDALAELERQLPTASHAKADQSGFLLNDDDAMFSLQDERTFDDMADIRLLCSQGRKIEAIKLYRERKGASLEEAKRAIDGMSGGSFATGNPSTPDAFGNADEVDQCIFRGEKIMAIKHFRQKHNLRLKEAKDAVEAREAVLRATSPEKFQSSSSQSSGGPGAKFILLMAMLMLGLIYWLFSV